MAAEIIELARSFAPPGTFVSTDSAGAGDVLVDGWANLITGLGTTLRDKRLAAVFQNTPLLQQGQLDALYAGDWLIARACDRPAADQVRRWVEVKVDGKKGQDDDIAERMKQLGIKARLQEAITWARLHGGALVVLGIDDGLDPSQPVNEAGIKGVGWCSVLDRWDTAVLQWKGGSTPYGEPEVYQVTTGTIVGPQGELMGQKVHESRVLRVDGVLTSLRVRKMNNGWTHGVVQRLYDQVRDFHQALGGAAHLTTDFAQAVVKLKGVARMMAEDRDGDVRNRLQTMDLFRSLLRMVVLDAEGGEEFTRVATPISGLPDLLDRLRDAICGAVDIPEKILFGKATAGLGDQGQSDLEQYYNCIEGEQERNVVPQVTKLARYLYLASGGEPKKWHVEPCALWTPTDAEVSENRKRDAETDASNITAGIYTADEARRSRFGGDHYGRDINIETDDEDLDGIPSADPEGEGGGPEEVVEVTGVVINAAISVVEKFIAGAITEGAARTLLKSALRLTDPDIDAMLEGAAEEREAKKAEAEELAKKMAEGGAGDAPPGPPGSKPKPKAPPPKE